MISSNVKIPLSLLNRLNKTQTEKKITNFVDSIAQESLNNIQEYGIGSAGGNKPIGGAPIWQGKITVQGHYAGYLSDNHYIRKNGNNHAQIISSADFTEGVIEGYSTNWNGVTFGPNRYHKRAVDNLYKDGKIPTFWKE